VHFEFHVIHTPTNALFINLIKSFKFALKYTIISLLHVSVFNDHHQGALSVPNESYIYVKTPGKITSFYMVGDVAAFHRAAHVLCAVRHAATSPNIYIKRRNFTKCFNINITLVRYG